MENPLFEIYQTVFNKVQEMNPIKFWFDIDMGQFDDDGYRLPITYPAILLKFEDVIWKDLDPSTQIGLVNVTVKYAHRFTSESEMRNGNSPRDEIRDCLQIMQDFHDLLSNVGGTSFSQLKRFNQYQRKTNPKDLLWVNVTQYQCNIQSNGAIDSPELLITDFTDIRNNNAFLERRRFNMIHK